MTRDDLRHAAELLAPGTLLTLSREVLLDALVGTDTAVPIAPEPAEADQWLDAEHAALRLGVSPRWIYDHADQLGVRRLSRRCVRFSARSVERFMHRRRASNA